MGRTSDARERILESACELFHAEGYEAIGVQAICDHAGVKKGSFYHFFPSKQQLALAMIDRQWERFEKQVLEPAFAADAPPAARIERLFAASAEMLRQGKGECGVVRGCPFGSLSLEMSARDDRIRRKLDQVFRRWAGWFESALEEAVEAGEIPELDVAAGAQALLAYLSGLSLLAKTQNSVAAAGRLAPRALGLVEGLAPRRAGAAAP